MSNSTNSFDDYSGNTFGMWIIEGKNQQEGGIVSYK